MLEKNSFPLGLILGILVPLIGFSVLYSLYTFAESQHWVSQIGFSPMFRERTCAIVGIFLNVIALNFYQKRYMQNSVRGVVIATTGWVVVWLVLFGKYVL